MGLLRLFLALSVIAGHSQTTVFGYNGIGAWYAVNFFFIISGFYMAMVLNEKYKDISHIHFYKSRLLRLLPAYYISVLIAFLVSFSSAVGFFEHLSLSGKVYFIFQNLFIFGQDLSYLFCVKTKSLSCAYPVAMTINPPAWSLAVELGFYFIAPYFLKSEKKTFVLFLLGCFYFLSLNAIHFPLEQTDYFRSVDISAFNYYFYPSSFVFFGGGALAYHLSKRSLNPHYFVAIFAIILLSFTQTIMPFWHLLFISLAIPVLFDYTATNQIDRSIGEMSYPTYILHFPVLLFLRPFTLTHPEYFKFIGLGSWVSIVSIAIGLLIYFLIEKRVTKYRSHYARPIKVFSGDYTFFKRSARQITLALIFMAYLFFPIASIIFLYSHQSLGSKKSENTAYNLTDNNWVNGVGINLTGFIVSNSLANIDKYQVGKFVRFVNGDNRQIIRVQQVQKYLNIFASGEPLNGKQIGYPNTIEVLK
jgi:peptidoglycan/LPS O-acetylase OafA/YrhL